MSEKIPLWSGHLKIDPTNIPTFTADEEVLAVKFMPKESSRLKEENFNWSTGMGGFPSHALNNFCFVLQI